MKFALNPYARGASNEDLLEDLQRVAKLLAKNSVTIGEYDAKGQYHSCTLRRRLGVSWFKVLEAAGLEKSRSEMNIPEEELLKDLIRVASALNKKSITRHQYIDNGGKFSPSTFCKKEKFGSWFKALEAAGLEKTRNLGVKDEEYFKNLEEIWIKLGRQPFYREIEKPFSRYCAGAYEYRFGSWRKALEAFVAYVNDDTPLMNEAKSIEKEAVGAATVQLAKAGQLKHKTKRYISNRLKVRVLMKYGPTCQICFKSRKDYPNLDIVFDHIKPWIKGGETEFENLQPLCRDCNGGKGDLGQSE